MSFHEFWVAYPRREGRKDALKAWAKLNPSPAVEQQIITALAWQVLKDEWQKEDGKYVPLPASWLRGERWTDERRKQDRRQSPTSMNEWERWREAGCPHTPRCPHYVACRIVSMRETKAS